MGWTIITGASANHFLSLQQFLKSAVENITTNDRIIVYNLGYREPLEPWDQIKAKFPTVQFRNFDYSKYPDYYNITINTGCYAWKPAMVREVSEELVGTGRRVIWCDAGNVVDKNTFSKLNRIIAKNNFYCIPGFYRHNTIGRWTHPGMLQKVYHEKKWLNRMQYGAGTVGFDVDKFIHVIREWDDLAHQKDVIYPEGSNHGNHRWDQALFNLLVMKEEQRLNVRNSLETVMECQQDVDDNAHKLASLLKYFVKKSGILLLINDWQFYILLLVVIIILVVCWYINRTIISVPRQNGDMRQPYQ
jgi:hypothetical protein